MNTTNTREDADTDRTHLLQQWTVHYGYGTESLLFHCQAKTITHAIDQGENAYPCNNVLSASLDALTGTNTIIVALPKAFQLMVDGTPQSGPWFILVDKTTGELAPDLMIGDVAFYASYDEARAALDFNLAEYAKESDLTDQQSQGSPSTSNNDAKRARITAAGYTIQSHNIGTNMEGWWALVPGETKFHIEEDGNQNYLGFFSNEQELLDQLDNSLTENALRSGKLYKDDTGYTVELSAMDTDSVAFSPQGGGFVMTLPRQKFEARFKPASLPKFHFVNVTADWLPDDLKLCAYSQGLHWNGWAMPRFELSAAKTLQEHMPQLSWNPELDEFRLTGSEAEPEDAWIGEDVQVGNQTLHLYPIGSGSWCWEEQRAVRTLDEAIARMKEEILHDVHDLRVPMDVKTFSELHDFVDANGYGGFCEDELANAMIAHFGGRDEHEGMPQGMLDFINSAQDAIDKWIAAGGVRAEINQLTESDRANIETKGALLREKKAIEPHTLGDLIYSMPLWRDVEWDEAVRTMPVDSRCGKACAEVLKRGHALAMLCRDVDTAIMAAVKSQVNIFVPS